MNYSVFGKKRLYRPILTFLHIFIKMAIRKRGLYFYWESIMSKDTHEWVRKVDQNRVAMVELVRQLARPGVIVGCNHRLRRVCNVVPFFALFLNDLSAETHIFFQLMDWQTNSDVVITNMTTLPKEKCRHGFGSDAVRIFLEWARENDLHEIRATQVGDSDSQRFWEKNGFVRCAEPNPCGDYVYRW